MQYRLLQIVRHKQKGLTFLKTPAQFGGANVTLVLAQTSELDKEAGNDHNVNVKI